MIIGEIRRYLRDNNSIRVSRSIKDTAYKAMQAKEKLTTSDGKEPRVEEIAKELEIPIEDVVIALESVVSPVSLYDPVYSDGGDTIYVLDQVGDKNDDKNWLDEIAFKEAIKNLSLREKHILSLRFMQGKTQMEVSEEIGISQAQVSRLEKGALEKIREWNSHIKKRPSKEGRFKIYYAVFFFSWNSETLKSNAEKPSNRIKLPSKLKMLLIR